MSAREKLEGYSMQPELLIDGEFPMLRVSHELGRIADEIERDEARAKSVLVPDLFGPVWVWRPVY